MAAGFEIYNEAGSVVIDAEHRHTVFDNTRVPSITDVGYFNGNTPFGNLNTVGFADGASNVSPYLRSGMICWARLNPGAWCVPGAALYQPGTVQFLYTKYNYSIAGGYLEVYDSSGSLTWSANGVSDMPRVTQYVDIPAGHDLQNNVLSFGVSYNPWIPVSSLPGWLTTDESLTTYTAAVIRWTGGEIQVGWISKSALTYNQIFQGRGNLRFPVAMFNGR